MTDKVNNLKEIRDNINLNLLEYEIFSSWWAALIWWDWGQDIVARYFVWKTRRKYARYKRHMGYKVR